MPYFFIIFRHLSKIIAINRHERKLKIHYYNLNSKYDEWISSRSTRIRRSENSDNKRVEETKRNEKFNNNHYEHSNLQNKKALQNENIKPLSLKSSI